MLCFFSQISLNSFIPRVSEEVLQVQIVFDLNGESIVLLFPQGAKRKVYLLQKPFLFFFSPFF